MYCSASRRVILAIVIVLFLKLPVPVEAASSLIFLLDATGTETTLVLLFPAVLKCYSKTMQERKCSCHGG